MNAIHDVGGRDGVGPVDTTEHEDTFLEEWESVTYATFVAGLGNGVFGIDEFRHGIERMPPRDYFDERDAETVSAGGRADPEAAYYEQWRAALEGLVTATDTVGRSE